MIFNIEDIEYKNFVKAVKDINECSILKASVVTFGCQQNEADSEKISGILKEMGYVITDNWESSDIIIFNTCAVREHAEKKALSIIGTLKAAKQLNPNMIIGVCGCMASENKTVELIKRSYHFISFTLETNMLHKLPYVIYSILSGQKRRFLLGEDKGDIVEGLPILRKEKFRAWVSIMYGCNNFCSYCIVPYTRGRERSRDTETVLAECRQLIKEGVKEITLLGQNVNSYSSTCNFAGLLRKIAEIDGDFIIRFMTSHPKDVPDELIEVMKEYTGKIAPFFHLPLQSGSDEILRVMNRKYDIKRYLNIVDKLRGSIPEIALSTDIIIGFPGETDDDFERTMNILTHVKYDNVYSFLYSKRDGTPAAKMQNTVPKDVMDKRMARLLETCKEISLEKNLKYEGKTVRVLVDGMSKRGETNIYSARTDTNKLVHIESDTDIIGKFVYVKIEKAKPFDLVGKLIK